MSGERATDLCLSAVFPRPAYQDRVKGQVGNHRATSDFRPVTRSDDQDHPCTEPGR